MWTIELYKTSAGKEIVAEFLDSLPKKIKAKAFWEIELLSIHGTVLREPYVKHIDGGLWELRIKFASDIARVFYFYPLASKIVLLHGFIKKTDKTPKREIETAAKRMADYRERSGKNEL
jgi:Phage-related protein